MWVCMSLWLPVQAHKLLACLNPEMNGEPRQCSWVLAPYISALPASIRSLSFSLFVRLKAETWTTTTKKKKTHLVVQVTCRLLVIPTKLTRCNNSLQRAVAANVRDSLCPIVWRLSRLYLPAFQDQPASVDLAPAYCCCFSRHSSRLLLAPSPIPSISFALVGQITQPASVIAGPCCFELAWTLENEERLCFHLARRQLTHSFTHPLATLDTSEPVSQAARQPTRARMYR